jgi:hypothetical protein
MERCTQAVGALAGAWSWIRRVSLQVLGFSMSRFMSMKHLLVLAYVVVLLCASPASAVVLFSDDFNTNTSGLWTKNAVPAANAATQTADFAFDYAPFGIPPAPGSSDTTGLRLRANVPIVGGVEVNTRPAGVLAGLSMSPTGQNFGANYRAQFYVWSNYFGSPNAQGLADNVNSQGGTASVVFALGTSGTVPQGAGQPNAITGSTIDGITFATTGDGGIADDYRVFVKSPTIATAASGVYAAGTVNDAGGNTPTNNSNAFYTSNPALASKTAPVEQHAIAAAAFIEPTGNDVMAGSTPAGSFGFAWQKVTITKSGNSVTWDVNDVRFATVDVSAITLGGNNIALGVSDVNATTARYPSLVFTIFDNLVVEDIAAPGVQADYNGNGVVDAGDYVVWRNGGPLQNEVAGTTPGTVTPEDYDAWRARFGNNAGSGSGGAVPEPATAALLVLAGMVATGSRRR